METPKARLEKTRLQERWIDSLYLTLRGILRDIGTDDHARLLDDLKFTYNEAITAAKECNCDLMLDFISGTMKKILAIDEGLTEAMYIGKLTHEEYIKTGNMLRDMHRHAIDTIEKILEEKCGCRWQKKARDSPRKT